MTLPGDGLLLMSCFTFFGNLRSLSDDMGHGIVVEARSSSASSPPLIGIRGMPPFSSLFLLLSSQEPSFNRGYWSDFEEFIRTLVVVPEEKGSKGGEVVEGGPPFKDVYVITGPLYLPSKESTPSSEDDDNSAEGEDEGLGSGNSGPG